MWELSKGEQGPMELIVQPDVESLAQAAAEGILAAAEAAIAARGRFAIALAGGSTPETLYRLLAAPPYVNRLDWLLTEIFFGDERCVPPDHEWSNYGMAWRTLLSRVPLPPQQLHRMQGEFSPAAAAESYSAALARAVHSEEGPWPRLDVILLGMGDDGHTASLFPGMAALAERSKAVVASGVPSYVRPQVPRVTLTLPVLNAARDVMFLVAGQGKAAMTKRVLERVPSGEGEDEQLPAARVRPAQGRLTWFLDQAAASLLQQE